MHLCHVLQTCMLLSSITMHLLYCDCPSRTVLTHKSMKGANVAVRKFVFAITVAIVFAVAIAAVVGTNLLQRISTTLAEPDRANNQMIIISTNTSKSDPFVAISDPSLPQLKDRSLKVEKLIGGLSEPTSMTFIGGK